MFNKFIKPKDPSESSKLLSVNDGTLNNLNNYGSQIVIASPSAQEAHYKELKTRVVNLFALLNANLVDDNVYRRKLQLTLKAVINIFNAAGWALAIKATSPAFKQNGEEANEPAMIASTILMGVSAIVEVINIAESKKYAMARKDYQLLVASVSQISFLLHAIVSVVVAASDKFGKNKHEVDTTVDVFSFGMVLPSVAIGLMNAIYGIVKNHRPIQNRFFNAAGEATRFLAYSATVNSVFGVALDAFNIEEIDHPLLQVILYGAATLIGLAMTATAKLGENARERVFTAINVMTFINLLSTLVIENYRDVKTKDGKAIDDQVLVGFWMGFSLILPFVAFTVIAQQEKQKNNQKVAQKVNEPESSIIEILEEKSGIPDNREDNQVILDEDGFTDLEQEKPLFRSSRP